jgi:hypothetical protein
MTAIRSTFGELFVSTNEQRLLDSLMPGGSKWREFEHNKGGNCLLDCPFFDRCVYGGPRQTECTSKWRRTKISRTTLTILRHVIENFVFYNKGDISIRDLKDLPAVLDRIRRKVGREIEAVDSNTSGIESYAERKQRSNQYVFRHKMINYWRGCSVTGVRFVDFLVASHIKPWSKCSEQDKLSKYNGLLLIAPLDFLFDSYHLTFDDNGNGVLSRKGKALCSQFGINGNIKLTRKLHSEQVKFMRHHRKHFYRLEHRRTTA